jgi:hypothetical protein
MRFGRSALVLVGGVAGMSGCLSILGGDIDFTGKGGSGGAGSTSSGTASTGGANPGTGGVGGHGGQAASSSTTGTGGITGTGGLPNACDGGTACTAADESTVCTATQATMCVVNACNSGCCGTTDAPTGTACTDNGGALCDGSGHCVKKGDDGATCSAGTQCTSGFCADGFCCNSACAGACQACSAALTSGTNGKCSSATDGTADPRGICALTAQSSCGTDGNCNLGACEDAYSGAIWATVPT